MADRTGQQLGHYRLVRLLGRGGFAEVYLGEHLRLNTQAAVKVLHTSLEDDDIERFLREAQTVARLKHPHIVRVFDFDIEAHIPFLVMDYLPNGSIRRLYPKGTPLPLSAIVSYVTQLASALQYAHDEKVIHRDVKPENMLLDRDNTLLLGDFGIALMAQSSRYQSTQEVMGTVAYMAPEQLQGKPHRASDQYALGVVVYEWLSGDRPFHGTFSELYSQHMFVPPQPLCERVPPISPNVEQVVLTALAKDPKERFASVQAFAMALEQANQVATIPPGLPPTEIRANQISTDNAHMDATAIAHAATTGTAKGTAANTIHIYDQASVLQADKVQSEAAKLSCSIDIYTVNNFSGTTTDFDQRTRSQVTSPRLLVIAIDTVHRHVYVTGGPGVILRSEQYQSAANSFVSNFQRGGYTGATIAAILSLQNSLV